MKIYCRTSMNNYDEVTPSLRIGGGFECPNCFNTEFEVWFTTSDIVCLTCNDCGNLIHIYKIDKE